MMMKLDDYCNKSDNHIFFSHEGKLKKVVEYLGLEKLENDEQKYRLILVSCYFTPEVAKQLIKKFSNYIYRVEIYIDKSDAFKIGKDTLEQWIAELSKHDFQINLKFCDSNNLFHPKAYCLLSNDNKKGSLVIGSANLTKNGLLLDGENIELLYNTQNIEEIRKFYKALTINKFFQFSTLDKLEEFTGEDDYYFQYAFVQEGYLVKKEDLTINEVLSFNYRFNEKGRTESRTDAYKATGLHNKKSETINYFEPILQEIEECLIQYNPAFKIDWGKYGIKTEFGYWIPKNLVNYLNAKTPEEIKSCKREINCHLNTYLKQALREMTEGYEDLLLTKDWLTNSFKPEKYEENMSFKDKQKCIEEHCRKILDKKIIDFSDDLEKILFRYRRLEIPFGLDQREQIKALYNIIKEQSFSSIERLEEESKKEIRSDIQVENLYLEIEKQIHDKNNNYLSLLNNEFKIIYQEFFEEYRGRIDRKILPKSITLAIETQDLGFLRCWDIKTFQDLSDPPKKPENEEAENEEE